MQLYRLEMKRIGLKMKLKMLKKNESDQNVESLTKQCELAYINTIIDIGSSYRKEYIEKCIHKKNRTDHVARA